MLEQLDLTPLSACLLAAWCAVPWRALVRPASPPCSPTSPPRRAGGTRMAAATAGGGGFQGKWVFALSGMIDFFCYLKTKLLERDS